MQLKICSTGATQGDEEMRAKAFLHSVAQLSLGGDQIHAAVQKTTVLPLLNLLKEKSATWLEQPCGSWVLPGRLCFPLSYYPCWEQTPGGTPSLAMGPAREKVPYKQIIPLLFPYKQIGGSVVTG